MTLGFTPRFTIYTATCHERQRRSHLDKAGELFGADGVLRQAQAAEAQKKIDKASARLVEADAIGYMSDDQKPRWKINIALGEMMVVVAVILVVGEPDLLDALIAKLGGITLSELKEMRK